MASLETETQSAGAGSAGSQRPLQIRRLMGADLIMQTGKSLEGFLEAPLRGSGFLGD